MSACARSRVYSTEIRFDDGQRSRRFVPEQIFVGGITFGCDIDGGRVFARALTVRCQRGKSSLNIPSSMRSQIDVRWIDAINLEANEIRTNKLSVADGLLRFINFSIFNEGFPFTWRSSASAYQINVDLLVHDASTA